MKTRRNLGDGVYIYNIIRDISKKKFCYLVSGTQNIHYCYKMYFITAFISCREIDKIAVGKIKVLIVILE